MKTREYYLNRCFSDSVHYPYGVEKSGDYSIKECQLLMSIGMLGQALINDDVSDATPADKQLVEVIKGRAEADSDLEKVYVKYWNKTHPKFVVPSMILAGNATSFSGHYSFDD